MPGAPRPPRSATALLDDDCDGAVDNGCACVNGTTQPCYTRLGRDPERGRLPRRHPDLRARPLGRLRRRGHSRAPRPATAQDNDCNGQIDEGLGTTICGVGACQVDGPELRRRRGPDLHARQPRRESLRRRSTTTATARSTTASATITCGVGACASTVPSCVERRAQRVQPARDRRRGLQRHPRLHPERRVQQRRLHRRQHRRRAPSAAPRRAPATRPRPAPAPRRTARRTARPSAGDGLPRVGGRLRRGRDLQRRDRRLPGRRASSRPATTCRASAGACDVAETCTGASAACPADALTPAGTVCRASAGACDVGRDLHRRRGGLPRRTRSPRRARSAAARRASATGRDLHRRLGGLPGDAIRGRHDLPRARRASATWPRPATAPATAARPTASSRRRRSAARRRASATTPSAAPARQRACPGDSFVAGRHRLPRLGGRLRSGRDLHRRRGGVSRRREVRSRHRLPRLDRRLRPARGLRRREQRLPGDSFTTPDSSRTAAPRR